MLVYTCDLLLMEYREKSIKHVNDRDGSEDESTDTIGGSTTEGAKKNQISVAGTSL